MSAGDDNPVFEPARTPAERQAEAEAALHALRAYAGRVAEQLSRLGHLRAGLQCQLAIHELDLAVEFLAAVAAKTNAECRMKNAEIPKLQLQQQLDEQLVKRGVFTSATTAAEHNAFPRGRW